ncbi:MAG TPA: M48 family metalloprotease [Burkholderiaceae bacterium]|nr:M48 family metalloprotease [Burkholderiaceae bacterium]
MSTIDSSLAREASAAGIARIAPEALVYPRERTLGSITLVLGVLLWLLLIAGTFGVVLVYLLLGFIGYVFAQSALIAYIRNTGVRLSGEQFPDLHQRFLDCCHRLGIEQPPEAYVLHGNGMFNAFAARFLGRHFVVLLSDVVDAMEAQPEGVNFYIGHELGHIRMKHLTGQLWRWPVLWLPLIGAAYARAKESTCDRHGRACCSDAQTAARALVALAAGARRWRTVDLLSYARQAHHGNGFWAAFHELIGGYPWLTKRVARVVSPEARMPGRNPLAYLLALLVPYGGRLGGAAGPLILVGIIGVLAAVALPAYQDYTQRAKVSAAWFEGAAARATLTQFYEAQRRVPATLSEAGLVEALPNGQTLALNPKTMELTLRVAQGELLMTPRADEQGRIFWVCRAGEGLRAAMLPKGCQAGPTK